MRDYAWRVSNSIGRATIHVLQGFSGIPLQGHPHTGRNPGDWPTAIPKRSRVLPPPPTRPCIVSIAGRAQGTMRVLRRLCLVACIGRTQDRLQPRAGFRPTTKRIAVLFIRRRKLRVSSTAMTRPGNPLDTQNADVMLADIAFVRPAPRPRRSAAARQEQFQRSVARAQRRWDRRT